MYLQNLAEWKYQVENELCWLVSPAKLNLVGGTELKFSAEMNLAYKNCNKFGEPNRGCHPQSVSLSWEGWSCPSPQCSITLKFLTLNFTSVIIYIDTRNIGPSWWYQTFTQGSLRSVSSLAAFLFTENIWDCC